MSSNLSDKEFWNEFLNLYRSLPYLWWDNADILAFDNRENFRMKTAKAKEQLLLYVKQRYPNADLPFVQRKIHNFRCGFHREYRKKQKLEAIGKVHRPLLWYYKKLLFLVDEENALDLMDEDNSSYFQVDKNAESMQNSVSENNNENNETNQLINIKKEPINETEFETQEELQHVQNNTIKHSPIEIIDPECSDNEYLDIEEEIIQLNPLKTQLGEQVTSSNQLNNNSLNVSAEIRHQQALKRNRQDTEDQHKDSIKVKSKKIKLNDIYNLVDRAITQTELHSNEDSFDVIGRKIANDLREMSRSQRIYADKIINDVIYYGKANRLRSTFSFSPST